MKWWHFRWTENVIPEHRHSFPILTHLHKIATSRKQRLGYGASPDWNCRWKRHSMWCGLDWRWRGEGSEMLSSCMINSRYSVISPPFYSLSGSPRLSAQCYHFLTHNPSFHCLNISLTLISMCPLGLLNLNRVENQNVPLTLGNAI